MKVSKDIRKYEVNGICLFAISLSFLGVRYRKQGIKTKEMAYTIAAKVRQDILEGNFDPRKYINADKQNIKFETMINEVWKYQVQSLRPSTIRGKESAIRVWLIPTLGKLPISALHSKDFERLFLIMRSAGLSSGSVKFMTSVINSIFRDAVKLGYMDHKIEIPSVKYTRKNAQRFLSKGEIDTLIEGAGEHQIGAIIATLYYCALRVSELAALKVSCYDKINGTLLINKTAPRGIELMGTKNGKDSLISVPEKLKPFLDKQTEGKEQKDFLFHKVRRTRNKTLTDSSVNTMLVNLCDRMGISPVGITTHIFRRSMSEHLINSKMSPKSVAAYLRDKPTTILSSYTESNPEDIKKLIDTF